MHQRARTTLIATAAAGLSALAVTVAAPAADQDRARKEVRTDGPEPAALVACLNSHGAQGVPAPGEDDGRALKEWIVAHQTDPASRDALKACDVYFDDKSPAGGAPDDPVKCSAPEPTTDAKRAALRGRPSR